MALIVEYIQNILKHRVWLVSSTILSIGGFFIVSNYYPEYNTIFSITLFTIGLIIAQFLSRKELYKVMKSSYTLTQEGLKVLQDAYKQDSYGIKLFAPFSKKFKHLLKELEEGGYISYDDSYNDRIIIKLETRGIQYIENRLPLK